MLGNFFEHFEGLHVCVVTEYKMGNGEYYINVKGL